MCSNLWRTAMMDQRLIFEIYRLKDLGLTVRGIARSLKVGRKTVAKYLDNPNPTKPEVKQASKLDSFKDEIARLLDIDPKVSGEVIRQRLVHLGFSGGKTIVNDYLQTVLGQHKEKRPFIRFESPPGVQLQIDWGHFGSLTYGDTNANSTAWLSSSVTAAFFIWSLPIPRDRKPCIAVFSMLSASFMGQAENWFTTICSRR